ncbi:MAG: hypothetical protein ACK4QL_08550 [Pseudanabaenaceae cyanobacterium]
MNSESKSFDPRSIGKPVYEKLQALKTSTTDSDKLKKQKSMAQEIYTYLSTWCLMRLQAEETILKDSRESPLSRHERPHRIIGYMVTDRDWEDFGSTTFFYRRGKAGVEPDTCFYVNNAALVRDYQDRIMWIFIRRLI